MSLHIGTRKLLTVTATNARGDVVTLENPGLTDPNLELVPGPTANTYFVRPSAAYIGQVGLQVPFVFTADGRPGEGEKLVSVDFGTETLYPGDVTSITGTVGDEENEPTT